MRKHRNLEIITGHVTSTGEVQRCSDPGVSCAHASGSQVYEMQFPPNFKLMDITCTPHTQNAQMAVYYPSPTAGFLPSTVRLSAQSPIGTNAPIEFEFTAMGYAV
jgi:hypothetical protein